MAKQETMTVYYGTDSYIINTSDLDAFLAKGCTKKASKAAANSTDADNAKAADTTTDNTKAGKTAATDTDSTKNGK